MSVILRGKPVAEALDRETSARALALNGSGITPTLAILRVGDRADDLSYERAVVRRSQTLNMEVRNASFPVDVEKETLLSTIRSWNDDPGVHGILIMRPLPAGIGEAEICRSIAPEKDVDGVTIASMAGVYAGTGDGFAPCTAEACIALLDHYGIHIAGKRAAVIGRSLVIGRPVSALLTARDATVTLCHSRTQELDRVIQNAELVVAALGKPESLTGKELAPGQVVLDVGIHYSQEKQKLVGDVAYDEAESVVRAITPVPGGVGSVTTSVLCRHVVLAAERMLSQR